MRIEGRLKKSGKFWAAEIPLLCIYTQGKSKNHAYAMVKDAIEALVDQESFSIDVQPLTDDYFAVSSNNDRALMAFALRQQRAACGLSQSDMAKALSYTSKNAYAQYEQGKVVPSLDKFAKFLMAMDKRLEPILKLG